MRETWPRSQPQSVPDSVTEPQVWECALLELEGEHVQLERWALQRLPADAACWAVARRERARRQAVRRHATGLVETLLGSLLPDAESSTRLEVLTTSELVAFLSDASVWQALSLPSNAVEATQDRTDGCAGESGVITSARLRHGFAAALQTRARTWHRDNAGTPTDAPVASKGTAPERVSSEKTAFRSASGNALDEQQPAQKAPSRFSVPRRLGEAAQPTPSAKRSREPSSQGPAADGQRPDPNLPSVPNVEPALVETVMQEILDQSPGVNWDDIAGLEYAKRCVMEAVVWPMVRPDLFRGIRGPPRGVLLFGPPGTGKTMIGRAIASLSGARFFNISASSLMSKWVGESEKLVRALFGVARALQPSVIFIDEMDSMLSARSENDAESSRRIKTEFLVQMDGAATNRDDRVLVIGASNRPQELDQAWRRRMARRLYIPLPDRQARRGMLQSLLRDQKHALGEAELERIVDLLDGYSGSDVYAACAEAALGPVRDLGADIANVSVEQVRAIHEDDFKRAAAVVRRSVSDDEVRAYERWNAEYGSFPYDPAPAAS